MGSVFVEIGARTNKLFKGLSDANRRIGQFGANLRSVGTRMMAAGAAMAAPLVLASRTFASFDDAIRATAAVTGATGEGLQRLTDKARHLGETTSFTATQVAGLMTELGRAGFKADEIISMTDAVLDLARATGTDASLAAKIMGQTMRQFGVEAGEATRVADVMTAAANATNTTVEDLGEALKMSGIQAAQAGLSLEDTVAILGTLGNVGLQGTMAGTSLRRLLNITAAEAKKMGEIFGVNTLDSAGNVRPIIDIFEDIAAATEALPSGERIARFNKAFGLLGITGAQAIGGSVGSIRELTELLMKAEGTAARTAQQMDAGLGGSSRIAMSAIEGLQISIGAALAPTLMHVLDIITNLARGFSEFVKNNEALVVSIAKGVAIFTAMGAAIYAAGVALSVFSAIAAVLLSPIVLIGGGLAAIVVSALALNGVFDGMGAILSTTLGGMYEALAGGDLAGAMDILWLGLQAAWLRGVANFVDAFEPWILFLQDTFDYAGTGIVVAWESMWSMMLQIFNGIVAVLPGLVYDMINGIMFSFDQMEATVRKSWNWVQSFIKSGFDLAKENDKVDSEMAARARQREIDTPGIESRTEEARRRNEEVRRQAQERIDAMNAEADRRAEERRNTSQSGAAREAADAADTALQRRSREAADARTFGKQAAELLANIENATTLDQLRDLYGEYDALSMNGKLSPKQSAAIEDALDDAQERITKASARAGGAGGAGGLKDQPPSGPSQAEVVGTFSASTAGLGFGSSLQQQMVDYARRTAEGVEQIADDGALAATA
jgi:TP901 family phage tail tape measure protein